MNQETAVQRFEQPGALISLSASAMDIAEIQRQSDMINDLLRKKMVEATKENNYQGHFGIIPGTKQKSLLKPGAEMIAKMFRLGAQYEHKIEPMPNGHINVSVTACIIHYPTQTVIGYGVGSCSTLESKHRYRTGPFEFTGKPVPKEYWDLRKNDPEGAQKLLGGRGFTAKKNPETGFYEIAIQGEKVENPDPADVWNTALKVAKKRAYVDGIQTCSAAGDIFMVNAENSPDEDFAQPNGNGNGHQNTNRQQQGQNGNGQRNQQSQNGHVQIKDPDSPASEAQLKCLYAVVKQAGISDEEIKGYLRDEYGVDSSKNLTKGQASELIEHIKSEGLSRSESGDDLGQAGY